MADKCVPEDRCGTNAPGWMQGEYPTVAEGVVTRKVCYNYLGDCCKWNNSISVKNCSGYFVYQLKIPSGCNLRYCGNGRTGEFYLDTGLYSQPTDQVIRVWMGEGCKCQLSGGAHH